MNEGKPGGKNEMPRNAKTRIWRVRFCPPEHMNMLSGRTRTSHPGGQERVTQEDKSESPGRTKMCVLEDASGALEARRANPLSDSLSCLPVILKNEYYANAYLVI